MLPVLTSRRAALEGFRQGMKLADKVAAEVAADHGSDLLEEAGKQIRTVPQDLP